MDTTTVKEQSNANNGEIEPIIAKVAIIVIGEKTNWQL